MIGAASIKRGNITYLASLGDGLRLTVPRGKWPASSIDGHASTHDCPRRNSHSKSYVLTSLHFGLCALKARVPWIVSPHSGQTCKTGERGGLVCVARIARASSDADTPLKSSCGLVTFRTHIRPPLEDSLQPQHTQWGSLAYLDVMGLQVHKTDHIPNIRTRSIYLQMRIALSLLIQNLMSRRSMAGLERHKRFLPYGFPPQFSVYAHYAMCQGAI